MRPHNVLLVIDHVCYDGSMHGIPTLDSNERRAIGPSTGSWLGLSAHIASHSRQVLVMLETRLQAHMDA